MFSSEVLLSVFRLFSGVRFFVKKIKNGFSSLFLKLDDGSGVFS